MSRIKALIDVVEDMRALGGSLRALADAIAGDDTPTATAKPSVKTVTLEQVRGVLAEKSLDGFDEEVRGLLQKHGARKLSAIDPGQYAELMREAKELSNAEK